MTLTGARRIPPIGDEHLLLQYFYDDGAKDQNDIPGFDSFLVPKIELRTANLRFWMAGDPEGMPSEADDVRDFLGLGYLNPGDSLVRISLSRSTLLQHLNAAASEAYRPSAFCVNDIVAPRFRGRHSSESNTPPVTHEYGMTANLSGGKSPSDGTQEWICPSIIVDAKEVHIELLGAIKNPRVEPNNAEFAAHLLVYGALTAANEKLVMNAICT